MGRARRTQPDHAGAQPDGHSVPGPRPVESEAEASCPDCGHPLARHEGSPEDEFVASHGGFGYAVCLECGCRTVIGISHGPKSA